MSNTSKREIIKMILFFLFLLSLLAFAIFIALNQPKYKVYDCSLSEISPDYPIEVKEECRRIRANYI
jgi:hypothetical protein